MKKQVTISLVVTFDKQDMEDIGATNGDELAEYVFENLKDYADECTYTVKEFK